MHTVDLCASFPGKHDAKEGTHINFFGSEQKRPGANRPPGFVPESPLQKGIFGSHIFSREL